MDAWRQYTKEREERRKTIEKLFRMAADLVKDYSMAGYFKLLDICSEWNAAHPDAEIFMCEVENGFCIECDLFTYTD